MDDISTLNFCYINAEICCLKQIYNITEVQNNIPKYKYINSLKSKTSCTRLSTMELTWYITFPPLLKRGLLD